MTNLEAILDRHEREKFAINRLNDVERARHQLAMLMVYKENPLKWQQDCQFTMNQVSQLDPIQPFPDWDYLHFLTSIWQREKLIATPKSRRMFCSWNFIGLYTHDTMFKPGRFNAFVSKKEDDAGDLVSRAEFIVQHIPEWRIPKALLPKMRNGGMTRKPPVLEFEDTGSKIQGIAMGADQLRQFTLSGILGDECAFWPDAEKFYAASKPTLDGGGRMTLISSRSPGFFKKLVFDKMDAQDLSFSEEAPAEVKRPMEGVEIWRNPKNKFVIVDLHYTANPEKRGEEWKNAVKASMPIKSYQMEYEKSWQTYEGKAVHEDFNPTLHRVKGSIEIEPGLPLLLGADVGLTPAIIVCQQVGRQFRAIREFIETNGSINRLMPQLWAWIKLNSPDHFNMRDNLVYLWCDPAMNKRADGDDTVTAARAMRESGLKNLRPGPISLLARREPLDKLLIYTDKLGPGFLISAKDCSVTSEGLAGGFQYPEKMLEIEAANPTPLKNKFSHPCEALQYVAAGAADFTKSYGNSINLPPPTYGFQRKQP